MRESIHVMLRELQRRTVDAIKRHAIVMSRESPRAQAYVLTEYLWAEEGTEATALHRTGVVAPAWLDKLIARQLADERRHAELLRARLAELAVTPPPPPRLARAKLWWLERAVGPYMHAFAAGPVVILLAVAAQLEATGVRVFARHLDAVAPDDRTGEVVRAILADERRHAKSCAAAAARLVEDRERAAFDELRERIARIDRAFGVTLAIRYWILIAALVAVDRMRRQHG